jgi:metacaspase-1
MAHTAGFRPVQIAGSHTRNAEHLSMGKGLALIIGLNAIDPAHYGTDGKLGGCENDAATMEMIAKKRNYSTTKLLTKAATLGNVRSAIEKIAQDLEPGDSFLLTYAGHGSQVKDEGGDEDDQLDETWCLYDGQLIDDELRRFWTQFKDGVTIWMVSDSCHSGSMLRAADDNVSAFEEAQQIARELGMKTLVPRMLRSDEMQTAYDRNKEQYDELERELNSQPVTDDMIKATVMLLSGCKDDQTSKDNGTHGVFTQALTACYDAGKFDDPDYSLADLHDDIVAKINPSLKQTPQFTSLTGESIRLADMMKSVFQFG